MAQHMWRIIQETLTSRRIFDMSLTERFQQRPEADIISTSILAIVPASIRMISVGLWLLYRLASSWPMRRNRMTEARRGTYLARAPITTRLSLEAGQAIQTIIRVSQVER